jgi:hypothetical protein
MKNFMHKRIKRFELEGQILDDSCIPRLREEYIRLLNTQMRMSGYAPRIDINPDFSIEYTKNHYLFKLSVYGSYIGKRNTECIEALDKNTAIYTQKNKSSASSSDQESTLNQK